MAAPEAAGGRANLRQRLLSAAVFVPAILLLVALGEWTLLALVLLVSARCAWEWCALVAAAAYRPDGALAMALSAAAVLTAFFAGTGQLTSFVLAAALLAFAGALRRGPRHYVANALLVLGGAVYAGVLGSAPILLWRQQGAGAEGRYLVAAIFICIWLTDAAAYACGRLWGRRKLAPSISPGKTRVGFFAGLAGSQVPLLLAARLPSFSPAELAGLFLLVGVGGQVGDLAESAIKRDLGNVKDAPALIPGHGGLLDRFDSYFFAFPLAYLYAESLPVLRAF